MKKLFLIIFLFFTINTIYSQDCNYQVCLEDSWGDGWNGNSIDVTVNNTLIYDDITLNNGSGPECHNLSVNIGDSISVTFNETGNWSDECYFYCKDGDGTILQTIGDGDNSDDTYNDTITFIVNSNCHSPINGDCHKAETTCDNSDIESNPTGKGNYQELNTSNHGSLLDNEHYSNWVYFHTEVDCEICFTISNNTNTDYDFAIWEGISCPPTSQPIRCSWAWHVDTDGDGNYEYDTGLKSTDNCYWEEDNQDTCGNTVDGFVSCIDANAGDEFTLLINNYDGDGNPFTLTWDLCQSDALDCTNLPVEFIFSYYDCSRKILYWQTATEINNDYFTIKIGKTYNHGVLMVDYEYQILGNDNSNEINEYEYYLNQNNSYVELWQTDFDGTAKLLNTNYISCSDNDKLTVSLSPNPSNENDAVDINGDFKTVQIYDMIGREIEAKILEHKIIGLNAGMYIVIIDNHYKFKLIIK